MKPDSYHTRVHKFSCKPPGHKATRQRENQRRHRARVKNRIAELEELLSNTQRRLDGALERVEELTAEVQRLQYTPGTKPITSVSRKATDPDRGALDARGVDKVSEPAPSAIHACPQTGCISTLSAAKCTLKRSLVNLEGNTPITIEEPRSASPPSLLNQPVTNPATVTFEDPTNDCAHLPPPTPNESTIPCREAYSIIQDRSAPEFDLSTATEWLEPGFRRAVVPGTGCRVQTHILFAFVDHITPI